jgi:D-serine dehydratase
VTSEDIHDGLKGVPPGTPPFALSELAARGWRAPSDLAPPFALLRRSALDHNRAFIRRLLLHTGALFAPHGKTTMSPELFREQLADGAWAITLATVSQVAMARRLGVPRILLANEVVDPHALGFLAEQLRRDPGFELVTYVDSAEGVRLWSEVQRGAPRRLPLLIEVGFEGGRAGCRSVAEALAVGRAVRAAPGLELRGVAGFEGLLHGETDAAQDAAVRLYVERIVDAAVALAAEDAFAPGEILLSAGGSAFFDLAASGLRHAALGRPFRLVLRSGCLLVHDDGLYARALQRLFDRRPSFRALRPGPRPALELWADVLSRPEPTRVVAGLGKRDVAHDAGWPTAKLWFRAGRLGSPEPIAAVATAALNDQHALLDVPADSPLRPGDQLGFGISHPCLTFDRWRLLFVVDDAYRVVGGVRTCF